MNLSSSDPAPSPATGERIGGMHLNRLESVRPPTGERPFQADAHP